MTNGFYYKASRPPHRPRSRMRAGFPSIPWEKFVAHYCDAFNVSEERCLLLFGKPGATPSTLRARVSYGGRKGRRALARLRRGPMKPAVWRAYREVCRANKYGPR